MCCCPAQARTSPRGRGSPRDGDGTWPGGSGQPSSSPGHTAPARALSRPQRRLLQRHLLQRHRWFLTFLRGRARCCSEGARSGSTGGDPEAGGSAKAALPVGAAPWRRAEKRPRPLGCVLGKRAACSSLAFDLLSSGKCCNMSDCPFILTCSKHMQHQ